MKTKALRLTGRHSVFDRIAGRVTRAAGSSLAFAFACGAIVAWAATGPMFGYAEAWQLVVNTGTTIVTFLMVFLIQHAQNKDSLAIHIKLNELLAATERASNRVVAIEDLDEADLDVLRNFYCELALQAEKAGGVKASHSLDEARLVAERKTRARTSGGRAQPES
ncbi:MAG TPA: low affinity iron permease family protein [Dokdonella sp.]